VHSSLLQVRDNSQVRGEENTYTHNHKPRQQPTATTPLQHTPPHTPLHPRNTTPSPLPLQAPSHPLSLTHTPNTSLTLLTAPRRPLSRPLHPHPSSRHQQEPTTFPFLGRVIWGVPPLRVAGRPPLPPRLASAAPGGGGWAVEGGGWAVPGRCRGRTGCGGGGRCEPSRSPSAAGPGWTGCGGGSQRIAEPLPDVAASRFALAARCFAYSRARFRRSGCGPTTTGRGCERLGWAGVAEVGCEPRSPSGHHVTSGAIGVCCGGCTSAATTPHHHSEPAGLSRGPAGVATTTRGEP
jgi:hypothetical protein